MFTQGLHFTRRIILHPLVSTAYIQTLHGMLQILKKKTDTSTQKLQHIYLLSPLSSKVSVTACTRNANNY